MKSEKDQEIFNLREQSQRLQVQLNNGHVGFSDFKEKKAKEVQELKNTIEAFSLKVWKQLPFTRHYNPLLIIPRILGPHFLV